MRSRSISKKIAELKQNKENSVPVEQPAGEAAKADLKDADVMQTTDDQDGGQQIVVEEETTTTVVVQPAETSAITQPEKEEKEEEKETVKPGEEGKMSDSELRKAFNCTKCQVTLRDVKLLKLHYWRVHIGESEIVQANRLLQLSASNMNGAQERLLNESQRTTDLSTVAAAADAKTKKSQSAVLHFLNATADSSTPNRKRKHRKSTTTATDVAALMNDGNRAKKRAAVNDDGEDGASTHSKSEASDERNNDQDSVVDGESESESESNLEKRKLEEKLSRLSDEEIKYFNLADDLDEAKLAERAESLSSKSSSKAPKKIQELKSTKIVWACWYCHARRTSIMWPAKIEKIAKDSTGKSKVYVKYFELNPKAANLFKMEPSKIEPFFKPAKEHFQYKELVTIHKPQRWEFFTCYTNALREFVQELEEREKTATDSAIGTDATTSSSSISDPAHNQSSSVAKEKYSIMGKTYSIDQVKEFAHKPFSDDTLEINRQRIAQSEKLFEALSSKQCQDYLLTIFTGESKCKRHDTYLKADSTTRRTQLKFSSPGPLIVAHQESLAKLLEDLSSNNYKDKPMHLKNYEYDVLYPESVIWALQKVEGLSYKKAESKYKMGFKRTEEEIIKSKCNEILNRIQKTHGGGGDEEMDNQNNSTLDTSMADQSELNASSSGKPSEEPPVVDQPPPQDPAISTATESSEKDQITEDAEQQATSSEPFVEPDSTCMAD